MGRLGPSFINEYQVVVRAGGTRAFRPHTLAIGQWRVVEFH
jgi:hypothetical protein